MFREGRINKLRELAENQKLQNNTYILINSQFDNEMKEHPNLLCRDQSMVIFYFPC
jgi:hypothetical protein